ncbi:hypothetical protein CKO36_08225 [Rhabdochromatium marinum]|nr:hypothetical protein [Rhabdochromatium marinum]
MLAAPLALAQAEDQPPSPVAPQTEAVDLASLLDGVEHQCHYNDILERFWRTLPNPQQAIRTLDPQLQSALGSISVADEDEFRMYSIPVHGTWHQVPVKQIQFGLGKGNGIHVMLVEFDAPPSTAEAIFAPLVEQSKTAMERDPDNTLQASTDLYVEDGKMRLMCDLST